MLSPEQQIRALALTEAVKIAVAYQSGVPPIYTLAKKFEQFIASGTVPEHIDRKRKPSSGPLSGSLLKPIGD